MYALWRLRAITPARNDYHDPTLSVELGLEVYSHYTDRFVSLLGKVNIERKNTTIFRVDGDSIPWSGTESERMAWEWDIVPCRRGFLSPIKRQRGHRFHNVSEVYRSEPVAKR
jgi:hypothetical protein